MPGQLNGGRPRSGGRAAVATATVGAGWRDRRGHDGISGRGRRGGCRRDDVHEEEEVEAEMGSGGKGKRREWLKR